MKEEKKSTYQRVKEERDHLERQLADAYRVQSALMNKCDELEDKRGKLFEQLNDIERQWQRKLDEERERNKEAWNVRSNAEHEEILKRLHEKEEELIKNEEGRLSALRLFQKQVDETLLNEEMVAWLLKRSPWLKWLFEKRVKEGYFKKRINESD